MAHYNVQIHVQKVEESKPDVFTGAGRNSTPQPVQERKIIDLLSVKVLADSEEEAYGKAATMLSAATPLRPPHVHGASCDDVGGNLVCGIFS